MGKHGAVLVGPGEDFDLALLDDVGFVAGPALAENDSARVKVDALQMGVVVVARYLAPPAEGGSASRSRMTSE